jgi:hypothetical protein
MSYADFYAQAIQAPRDKARARSCDGSDSNLPDDAAVKELPVDTLEEHYNNYGSNGTFPAW